MGKRLIINGADFSVNGIAPEYLNLAWIGGTIRDTRDGTYTEGGVTYDASLGEYISTGIHVTENTRLYIEFIAGTEPRYFYVAGGNLSTGTGLYALAAQSKLIAGMMFRTGTTTHNQLEIQGGLWDGEKHTVDISKGGVVLDGVSHQWEYTPQLNPSATNTSLIYLDCASLNYNPNSSQYANTALYYVDGGERVKCPNGIKICRVKVYTDYTDPTSLAVDAIPAKRTSDNKVGFYNLVNGDWFFRNNDSTPTYGTL